MGVAKIDFKPKNIPRGKEAHYIAMKYSIQEEDSSLEKMNLGQRSKGGTGTNLVDIWRKSLSGFQLWKSLPPLPHVLPGLFIWKP